jgi:peroxidase
MNGCHASILLENDERQLGPNLGLQQAALNLIKSICTKVHAACGPTVSCADITVLATRDAVNLAGAPTFTVNLGRKDSLAPASQNDVFTLPPPSFTADQLLRAFSDKGLDNFDLVALSNAHTVGKARCSAFGNPSAPTRDDLRQCLAGICTSATPNRLHDLDFLTAEVFDNMYFIALRLNKGVMLNSDQVLATHTSTNWLVKGFVEPTTTNLRSKRAQ